jgi:hypothetical protein
MRKASGLVFIVIFLVVIVAVALSSGSLVEGYPYQANMAQATLNTLTALIAVSLFVERGMTVVNAILHGEEQRNVELGLADGTRSPQDLARVLGAKERVRLLGAFIAALFVSAAGVRTLEGLLDTNVVNHQANPLLIPVDVVLTASLIAGGSNGLAYLLQVAKERLGSGSSTATTPKAPAPGARGAGPGGPAAPASGPINPALRARLISTG